MLPLPAPTVDAPWPPSCETRPLRRPASLTCRSPSLAWAAGSVSASTGASVRGRRWWSRSERSLRRRRRPSRCPGLPAASRPGSPSGRRNGAVVGAQRRFGGRRGGVGGGAGIVLCSCRLLQMGCTRQQTTHPRRVTTRWRDRPQNALHDRSDARPADPHRPDLRHPRPAAAGRGGLPARQRSHRPRRRHLRAAVLEASARSRRPRPCAATTTAAPGPTGCALGAGRDRRHRAVCRPRHRRHRHRPAGGRRARRRVRPLAQAG